jgi:hypothetical protein
MRSKTKEALKSMNLMSTDSFNLNPVLDNVTREIAFEHTVICNAGFSGTKACTQMGSCYCLWGRGGRLFFCMLPEVFRSSPVLAAGVNSAFFLRSTLSLSEYGRVRHFGPLRLYQCMATRECVPNYELSIGSQSLQINTPLLTSSL